MIKLVKVVETCSACPAQWDAWDDTGKYYYLRYRHGRATVERLPTNDVETWPLPYPDPAHLVASWETEKRRAGRTDHDGSMELGTFIERTAVFELAPDAEIVPWEYGG